MSEKIWSTVSKINFFENFFQDTIRVSNGLDPDRAWLYVGPNSLQRLSAKNAAAGKELTKRTTKFYVTKTVAKHIPTAHKLVLWNIKYI